MANIHILTTDETGTEYKAVMHIPIPNVNNSANVNYRTALINSGIGGKTILLDGDGTNGTIAAAEKASIASGALYEYVTTLRPGTAGNQAGINAYLDDQFSTATSDVQTRLQQRLKYFGATR